MANVKHLLLDVNVIVDLWLGVGSEELTQEIFDLARKKQAKLWITAASIATIDYVAKRSFKQRGVPPTEARPLVANLMDDLFQVAEVLSNHGFEQKEIYGKSIDFEDGQIASALRSLRGVPVCIVSEDSTFDALGEVPVKSPMDALVWLYRELGDDQHSALPFINLSEQQARLRPQIEQGIEKVLRHGQYIMGPEVTELEGKLAAYTGAKHCITVASGTEALLISLMALGIGPGDEVITTSFTFVATAEVIVLLGATPVFVDIEPDTCNIDASKIEAAITDKTRAIIPVSLYGQPADMDEINAIAEKHTKARQALFASSPITHSPSPIPSSPSPLTPHPIIVIEDAAQSFGATYKGRKSCNLSTIGCTSFFPSKPLGCYGDGGAVFTSDDAIAQACREIRVHGQSKRYVHTRIGVGGRMDTLQCAVVLAKLERFDWEVERRLEIGARYNALMDERGIPRVQQRSDRTSVFAQYTVMVEDRDAVQKKLVKEGANLPLTPHPLPVSIPTAVHYPIPLNQQPAYREGSIGETPIAARVAEQVMSLPMSADLAESDQSEIVDSLRQFKV